MKRDIGYRYVPIFNSDKADSNKILLWLKSSLRKHFTALEVLNDDGIKSAVLL